MTRVTFGISASSYAANMAVRQNAADFALDYPLAARAVDQSFYVDDGLTGADSVKEAITLQQQLQQLFDRGGFLLRKWNSSDVAVLEHIPNELKDVNSLCAIPDPSEYTKTLGIQWNEVMDHFRLTIAELPGVRRCASWCPTLPGHLTSLDGSLPVQKILFQRLWELKVDWDDPVPDSVKEPWMRWRSELNILSTTSPLKLNITSNTSPRLLPPCPIILHVNDVSQTCANPDNCVSPGACLL